MKRVTILRIESTPECVIGTLSVDGEVQCFTYELPWKDNQDDISCIPPGVYYAVERFSNKQGYKVYELIDVPDRDNVQIHIGNTGKDTTGCILPGMMVGHLGEATRAVLASKKAFDKVKKAVGHNRFMITIAELKL